MTEIDNDFEVRKKEWERLFDGGRWEDLIEVTITDKALLSKRYAFEAPEIAEVLGWLRLAINQSMEGKLKSSPECSFCGKKPPAVKLGAGPSAFICNECVGVFSEIFVDV